MLTFLTLMSRISLFSLIFVAAAAAQDPTGILQGQIKDPSGARVPKARVTVRNVTTGFTAAQHSSED